LQEVPQPQPLEGEMLIKVLASTINRADILFIAGKYRMQPNLPQIAGLEGVGVVMQQGKNTLTPTQTLVASRHKNVWAEYVVVPEKKDNCVICLFFDRESRSVHSQSNYCIRAIIAQ
jgi:NADPH:quinone reductase-like Zn-dependent oxidoreductase